MSHRKDQKEALRREREERERAAREARQRKRLVGFGSAGALVVAVVIILVVALAGGGGDDGEAAQLFPTGGSVPEQAEFEVPAAAKAAGCRLKSTKGTGVATHTRDPKTKIKYRTNPPTSGRHYQQPAQDGVYGQAPPDEVLVHNLEHGRVVIWAKPTLSQDQRASLRALVDEDPYQMVLVPRAKMPYEVAASAWNRDPLPGGTGRLLLCDKMNPKVIDALRSFRDEHRSNGPEPVP
jgi:Protein of unknown function (DUF3105)